MGIRFKEVFHWRQPEEDFFQLHLIANAGGCFRVVLEKLKAFRVHMSVETTAHTQPRIARLNACRFRLSRRDREQIQQRVITKRRNCDLLERTGKRFRCTFDSFISSTRQDMRAEETTRRTVLVNQT